MIRYIMRNNEPINIFSIIDVLVIIVHDKRLVQDAHLSKCVISNVVIIL